MPKLSYPVILNRLRWLSDHPDVAERFVRNIYTGAAEEAYRAAARGQVIAWKAQVDMMGDAHIFEFDEDTAFLMTLTNNEVGTERNLPFPVVFIDAPFDIPGEGERRGLMNRYLGILLAQDNAWFEALATTTGELMVYEVAGSHIMAYGYLHPKEGSVRDLIDANYPMDVAPKELLPPEHASATRYGLMGRYGRTEWRTFRNLVANFLDLLDTPDVYLVQVRRGPKNAMRRRREGKLPLPASTKVYLRPNILRYINRIKSAGQFHYSHRFWVRGHFKHWRNVRYTRSGKRFQKTWTPPYIKGEGILIQKRYVKPGAKTQEGTGEYRKRGGT